MAEIVMFSSIVEENGKTIKENNMEIKHNVPVGAKVLCAVNKSICDVDIKMYGWWYVWKQTRDCDGSPMYTIGPYDPSELFPHGWNSGGAIKDAFLRLEGGLVEEDFNAIL